jgi:hypothetical protein
VEGIHVALELHVRGEITYGRLSEFLEAVEVWRAYRAERGWAVPRVLLGLSGPMNLVLMIFAYPDTGRLEAEEAAAAADPRYAEIAGALGFREPSIVYELFHPAPD